MSYIAIIIKILRDGDDKSRLPLERQVRFDIQDHLIADYDFGKAVNEAIKKVFDAPPALGVHVQETIKTKDSTG